MQENSIRGYLVHEHTDQTSEGFGSHARGVLYPLLHISLVNGLQPILPTYAYKGNTARDYNHVMKNMAQFLSLSNEVPSESIEHEEMIINTWNDPVVGSACGDGAILASLIHAYFKPFSKEKDSFPRPLLVIRLVGALRYMNPTKVVYQWLQNLSQSWNNQLKDSAGQSTIAAHIRVPEEFCQQSWKEDNSVQHLIKTLHAVDRHLLALNTCHLKVYTEERFPIQDEAMLRQNFARVEVLRGRSSTVLNDVHDLASADILIPSSSHFSAIAGYLSHGLIILPHPSRWDYFQPHAKLEKNRVVDSKDIAKHKNPLGLLHNGSGDRKGDQPPHQLGHYHRNRQYHTKKTDRGSR